MNKLKRVYVGVFVLLVIILIRLFIVKVVNLSRRPASLLVFLCFIISLSHLSVPGLLQ
jgi:quinol-cytochrome oxidoreductase complex cytochrome b subunit